MFLPPAQTLLFFLFFFLAPRCPRSRLVPASYPTRNKSTNHEAHSFCSAGTICCPPRIYPAHASRGKQWESLKFLLPTPALSVTARRPDPSIHSLNSLTHSLTHPPSLAPPTPCASACAWGQASRYYCRPPRQNMLSGGFWTSLLAQL